MHVSTETRMKLSHGQFDKRNKPIKREYPSELSNVHCSIIGKLTRVVRELSEDLYMQLLELLRELFVMEFYKAKLSMMNMVRKVLSNCNHFGCFYHCKIN
jgi:hypothetical protein